MSSCATIYLIFMGALYLSTTIHTVANINSAVRGSQDERETMDGVSTTDASQQHDDLSVTGASQQYDSPSITSQQLDSHWTSMQVPRQVSGRSLRKSCDRCHQQKLRCVGNNMSRQACARCQHLGAECVYNVRSSKQANNNKGSRTRHNSTSPTEPVTPVLNHHQPLNFGAFHPDQLQLGSFFSSDWDAISASSLPDPVLVTHTHSGYASSTLSMTSTVFNTSESGIDDNNFIPAAPETCRSGGDLSAQLASVCQTLETLFKRVTSERTGHAEQCKQAHSHPSPLFPV